MKVLVLGAGVIGVTTAYFLKLKGYDVTVVDRNADCALETSFANGGQLSYGHAEPWANPQTVQYLSSWILRKNSPVSFTKKWDKNLWKWCLEFLGNCTKSRSKENTQYALRLAMYSKEVLDELRPNLPNDWHYHNCGCLHVYGHEKGYKRAIKHAEFQASLGYEFEVLTEEQCLEKEPMLAQDPFPHYGGIYFPKDAIGDAYLFTKTLAKKCQELGVVFQYDTDIRSIELEDGKVDRVVTEKGDIKADAYVVATGSYTPTLLQPLGLDTYIYPMKGYSLSIPTDATVESPHVSIIHQEAKIVASRLGSTWRVAGLAEMAGYNTEVRPEQMDLLKRYVRRHLPQLRDFLPEATEWSCLRPSTPDCLPIIDGTAYKNLYLNTGHGSLGWTLACGSAKLLADYIDKGETDLPLKGYKLNRF